MYTFNKKPRRKCLDGMPNLRPQTARKNTKKLHYTLQLTFFDYFSRSTQIYTTKTTEIKSLEKSPNISRSFTTIPDAKRRDPDVHPYLSDRAVGNHEVKGEILIWLTSPFLTAPKQSLNVYGVFVSTAITEQNIAENFGRIHDFFFDICQISMLTKSYTQLTVTIFNSENKPTFAPLAHNQKTTLN